MNKLKVQNQPFYHTGPSNTYYYSKQKWPVKPSVWGSARRRWKHAGLHYPEFQGIPHAGTLGKRRRQCPSSKLTNHFYPPSAAVRLISQSEPQRFCLCVSLQAGLMYSPLNFNGRVVVVTGAGGGEYAKCGGLALISLSCRELRFSGLGYVRSHSCGHSVRDSSWQRWRVGEEAAWGASDGSWWGGLSLEHQIYCGGRGGAGQPSVWSQKHLVTQSGAARFPTCPLWELLKGLGLA